MFGRFIFFMDTTILIFATSVFISFKAHELTYDDEETEPARVSKVFAVICLLILITYVFMLTLGLNRNYFQLD